MKLKISFLFLTLLILSSSCKKEEDNPKSIGQNAEETTNCIVDNALITISSRNFKMGFSTWPYGPNSIDQINTYSFIQANSDIYSEHLDDKIPWSSWINNTSLPQSFIDNINTKVSKKIPNSELLLSIGLFNDGRTGLKEDFNGLPPNYDSLNEKKIEDAYFAHVNYLIQKFQPNYLVAVIEANDFLKNDSSQWTAYKSLMQQVRFRIKQAYPNLPVSESITLHNFYLPEVTNPNAFIQEVASYSNQFDFSAISFYPFFKNLHSKAEFQQAFDFLHNQITKPIAFVETTHLSEDLIIPNLNTNISSNLCEQQDYLEVLALNAYHENYNFFIWWAHRDYDELWRTFPPNLKDLGQVWRDTGVLDENGNQRPVYETWDYLLNL